jgi:hypothetical protein
VLSDGVYYSKWVYKKVNDIKTYPVLSDNVSMDAVGIYLSLNEDPFPDAIYLEVKTGKPDFYYRQVNNDGGVISIGKR